MSNFKELLDSLKKQIELETIVEIKRRGLTDNSVNRLFAYYTMLQAVRSEAPDVINEATIFALKYLLTKEMKRFVSSDYRS